MKLRDARDIFKDHFRPKTVKQQVIDIARTPTPQTELYEREPMILRAIREVHRPAFEAAGCDTWIDDYGNLVATQGLGAEGPTVMLLGYGMSWAEGTLSNPWSGEVMDGAQFGVDGEVVWGRSGSEYHTFNAAMAECARIITASGVSVAGRVIYVVSTGGHTSSSDPIYHLVHNDHLRADMCIIPGDREIVLGNMGRLDLRVNVHGRVSHSGGAAESGLNAIEGGLEVIQRLRPLMPFPPGGMEDPDLGQGRLSLIGLSTYPASPGFHDGVGSGGHVLQSLFRMVLDRRLVPGEDVDAAIEEIKTAVGDMSPWRVTFERGAFQYPWKHEPDAEIITNVAEAFRVAYSEEPKYKYVHYTLDAGYLNMVGIPTVMFGGTDMRFAHTDVDFAQLNETYDLAHFFTVWVLGNIA